MTHDDVGHVHNILQYKRLETEGYGQHTLFIFFTIRSGMSTSQYHCVATNGRLLKG